MRRPIRMVVLTVGVLVLGTACLFAQIQKKSPSSELTFKGDLSKWPPHKLRSLVLPNGRLAISIGETVYMLDADGKELWKYRDEGLTTEPAFSLVCNEIAVVMYDLSAVRLDAMTGRVKWKSNASGRGSFVGVASYDRGFLVVVDMSGYRENGSSSIPDRLEYWGASEKDFWYIDFPPRAELVVNGKRIYALRTGKEAVSLRELHPPPSAKPL